MAELPSVCEHMNLPVQAGDNEVLRRMRRTYYPRLLDRTASPIRDDDARTSPSRRTSSSASPARPTTQFQQTHDLLERARCDKVHLAMYSPRPGTLSARWEDDVPAEEKHRRHLELERLQERLQTEIHATRLGDVSRFWLKAAARDDGQAARAATPSSILTTSENSRATHRREASHKSLVPHR